MRLVLQRVNQATLTINGVPAERITHGFVILLGIEHTDTQEDSFWLAKKVSGMRLFSDTEGKMNLSLESVNGELMVISQFTLHASTKKGTRPSFIRAAQPVHAEPLYNFFISALRDELPSTRITHGKFGADMQIALTNDGPVTIFMDTKNKE